MRYWFSRMLLNGVEDRIWVVQSDKEGKDLSPGDIVEYCSVQGRKDNWKKARIISVSYPEVEISLVALCHCGKEGEPKVDNGLPTGVHCDECWEKMVTECRSRSW